jgi:hypothetical protein
MDVDVLPGLPHRLLSVLSRTRVDVLGGRSSDHEDLAHHHRDRRVDLPGARLLPPPVVDWLAWFTLGAIFAVIVVVLKPPRDR